MQQGFLVGEVPVEGCPSTASGLRDLAHSGTADPVAHEHPPGCFQDPIDRQLLPLFIEPIR